MTSPQPALDPLQGRILETRKRIEEELSSLDGMLQASAHHDEISGSVFETFAKVQAAVSTKKYLLHVSQNMSLRLGVVTKDNPDQSKPENGWDAGQLTDELRAAFNRKVIDYSTFSKTIAGSVEARQEMERRTAAAQALYEELLRLSDDIAATYNAARADMDNATSKLVAAIGETREAIGRGIAGLSNTARHISESIGEGDAASAESFTAVLGSLGQLHNEYQTMSTALATLASSLDASHSASTERFDRVDERQATALERLESVTRDVSTLAQHMIGERAAHTRQLEERTAALTEELAARREQEARERPWREYKSARNHTLFHDIKRSDTRPLDTLYVLERVEGGLRPLAPEEGRDEVDQYLADLRQFLSQGKTFMRPAAFFSTADRLLTPHPENRQAIIEGLENGTLTTHYLCLLRDADGGFFFAEEQGLGFSGGHELFKEYDQPLFDYLRLPMSAILAATRHVHTPVMELGVDPGPLYHATLVKSKHAYLALFQDRALQESEGRLLLSPQLHLHG